MICHQKSPCLLDSRRPVTHSAESNGEFGGNSGSGDTSNVLVMLHGV